MRLMPTSMITAPALTQYPLTSCALPAAATMISADRHTSARSTVCLLQTMTVHPCSKSSRATGLPTILDLPITTARLRSEEHTSELQSLMRISYAVFCLKKKKNNYINQPHTEY